MDFYDQVHDRLIGFIEKQRNELERSWEEIETLSFLAMPGASFDDLMRLVENINSLEHHYSYEEWKQVIEALKAKEKPDNKKIIKLATGTKNDAKIPNRLETAWQQYRKKLQGKGWDIETINSIQNSAISVVRQLDFDTLENGPVKGLVVGNVQSGKTANMAGVMAMAADHGFNYFIVLSGMIENLREQTETRLFNDLHSDEGNLDWHIVKNPHPTRHSIQDSLDNLDLKQHSRKRYMSVVLKNSVRMKNLVKYIYSNEAKAKQLKILVIDDEADQASINTKKLDETKEEEQERTAINQSIVNLVHGFNNQRVKAMNYISYTATPYANILNESAEETLYPSDFIMALPVSPNYIGPKQLFGLTHPEENPPLLIVREIPENDIDLLHQIHKGEYYSPPKTLVKAIQWFLIASVSMQIQGYKKPTSMLVHTSHIVNEHERVEEVIRNYLLHIQKVDQERFLAECKNLYLIETSDFTKEDFITGMPDYTISCDKISDYPEWDKIENRLRALLARDESEYLNRIKLNEDGQEEFHRGIHLCMDNSKATISSDGDQLRLVYPNEKTDPGFSTMFIVIGGNTLSRGLTLEGLISSYFMRNTITSDSLMQMGRWFGYRMGYELYPRVWLNEIVTERFQFVSQLDEELRNDIEEFAYLNKMPREYGLRVKNSPNNAFIQITSKNKMQGAIPKMLNFEGIQKQTILFENDLTTLTYNKQLTTNMLESLDIIPTLNGNRLVWEKVPYTFLKENFLTKYKASEKDSMFNNLQAFIDWCDSIDNEDMLSYWNVVVSSKGEITTDSTNSITDLWQVGKFSIPKVSRTVLNEQTDGTVSIGALRSPKDLLSDILDLDNDLLSSTPSMLEVKKIRKEYGVDKTPQLVIYCIDKNSKPNESNSKRRALNFKDDIIGISLMIPGLRKQHNIETSLTINVPGVVE